MEATKNPHVDLLQLDISSFQSILQFSTVLKDKYPKLDILIHNAAYLNHGEKNYLLSQDGIELSFAANYYRSKEEKGMKMEKGITSVWKLLFLHLFPGIMLSIIYLLLLKSGVLAEYPKLVIIGVASLFSIIPIELGYLFYIAKKEDGSFNIFKILGLKSTMKMKEYIFYTLSLFLLTGILTTALKPLSDYLLHTVFSWIPSSYNYMQDISLFERNFLIITIVVSFFIFTIVAPIIEELYFRGYLLARMKWMGKYSVLVNVTLFSIYHFWSPWLIITRLIALFPLFYIVNKKDSLKLAILVHCLLNFTDVVVFITLL